MTRPNLTIFLTRHGQDEDNAQGILNGRRDKPLTKLGIEQATNLAKDIKKKGISINAIYSSPLIRTFKTATTISNILNLPEPKK